MINLRDQILKSQIAYYNGLIAKHQQNVEIYLNQPVGIGEHSDVMGTIDGEINSIALNENNIIESDLRKDIVFNISGLTSILSAKNSHDQIIFI